MPKATALHTGGKTENKAVNEGTAQYSLHGLKRSIVRHTRAADGTYLGGNRARLLLLQLQCAGADNVRTYSICAVTLRFVYLSVCLRFPAYLID